MAAGVVLDRAQIESILSLYRLDTLEEFGGVVAEGARAACSCWLRAGGRTYELVVRERRRLEELVFEKELLAHLAARRIPVPGLLRNVARGSFTPWSARGRFVSIYASVPGRALGRFEVGPAEARAVGELLGRLHLAGADFGRVRPHAMSREHLPRLRERLARALRARRLGRVHRPAVLQLERALEAQAARPVDALPRGTLHGALTLSRARFSRGALAGVVDLECAATGRFVLDLAIAIDDWCWTSDPSERGPSGRFDAPRLEAMIEGYRAARPLEPAELEALPAELALVATVSAAQRLLACEVRGAPPGAYRDPRHHLARLAALEGAALPVPR